MKQIFIDTYIEFERSAIDDDALSGFVVAYSDDLTLLQRINGELRVEGYTVFRNSDVTSWTVFDSPDYFKNRALRLMKIRPRRPRGVDISCWHQAFETASGKYPLLAVYREAIRRDVCHVGKLVGWTPKTVSLYEISPTAEWEKPTRFRLKDVTRLDFGGRYEEALWRIAEEDGPFPAAG